jgi:hypothetical protein
MFCRFLRAIAGCLPGVFVARGDSALDVGFAVFALGGQAVVGFAEQSEVVWLRRAALAAGLAVVVLEPGSRWAALTTLVLPAAS